MAEFITDRAGIQAFRETDDYKKILAEAYKWHKKHGTMKGFDGGADLGIKFRPKNVVNYDKQTGLGSDPIASRKAEGKARLDKIKKQTVGKKNLPKTDTAAIEVHHQRMVDLYDNLYEGLDDADSAKLSQFFSEDLNMPLGDKYANAAFLPKKPHDKVHKFIDNEVLEGLPDFNSPKYNKVELPDGTILEGLEARKFHAKNFFGDLVQPAIDDATMGIMQDFAKNNPKSYKNLYNRFSFNFSCAFISACFCFSVLGFFGFSIGSLSSITSLSSTTSTEFSIGVSLTSFIIIYCKKIIFY